jgi:Tfp pilus assembly protein PilF
MSSNRLKILEQFLQEEPHDPFNAYALALEYLSIDRAKAETLFAQLLAQHPDYIPTYYHAGNFFLSAGETERAIEVWRTGLARAKQAGDVKAMRELQEMLSATE